MISYYENEVFLVQVGNQLYANKKGYFLDNITANTPQIRSFIRSITRNTFFLHHRHQYDLYSYRLDTSS